MSTIHELIEAQLSKVEGMNLGQHLDENMKFPIAALLHHNFQIKSSCGGHLSQGSGGLYIDMIFPRYDEFVTGLNGHMATIDDKVRLQKVTSLVTRQALMVELTLVRHLNDFYQSHHTTYENMLQVRTQSDFTIRLDAIGAEVVEKFGNEYKRREWIRAANREFFDFGLYLFQHPLLSNPWAE